MFRKLIGFLLMGIMLSSVSSPAFAETEIDLWAALEKGDYETTAKLGREMSRNVPEYYLVTAIAYQNLSQFQLSEIYLRKFIKNGDYLLLRNILLTQQTLSQDQAQVLLLETMITLQYPEVKLGEARGFLSKIGNQLQNNPYYYNYLALNAINNRDYSVGIQKYLQKAITLKKDYPEPYLNLAICLIQNKETERALSILMDCFHHCPNVPMKTYETFVDLIGSPISLTIKPFGEEITNTAPGIKEQYRVRFKEALQKVPLHLLGLAEYFIQKGNPISARELLTDNDFGSSSRYCYLQLQMAHLEGDQVQVITYGNELLHQNDLDYRRLVETGNVFFYAKDFKTAEGFYLNALGIINSDDDAYLHKIFSNLGTGYYLVHDYQNAVNNLEKALSFDDEDPISWVNLGLTYRDMGDKAKAIEFFNRSLEFIYDPEWRQEVNDLITELNNENPPELGEE